jgi:uncharacterized membrane protein
MPAVVDIINERELQPRLTQYWRSIVKKSFFMGISFLVVLMLLVTACSSATSVPTTAVPATDNAPATDTPTQTTTMTDAEMKALITERCGSCHSADIVFNSSFSQSQWSTVFDQMIVRGAQVSADEKTMMIDWLVANQ